jgi:hypothetical protein
MVSSFYVSINTEVHEQAAKTMRLLSIAQNSMSDRTTPAVPVMRIAWEAMHIPRRRSTKKATKPRR